MQKPTTRSIHTTLHFSDTQKVRLPRLHRSGHVVESLLDELAVILPVQAHESGRRIELLDRTPHALLETARLLHEQRFHPLLR